MHSYEGPDTLSPAIELEQIIIALETIEEHSIVIITFHLII